MKFKIKLLGFQGGIRLWKMWIEYQMG
jgi:hypothetical protein